MEKLPQLKFQNGDILKANEVKIVINGELTIQKFSYGYDLASRTSIINHLINKNHYSKYLEIGVRKGNNFNKIKCENKLGVDPEPLINGDNILKMYSDEFFRSNKEYFDIIFIDGSHLEKQVDKDIVNSLSVLNENGIIVMHDCNPPTEFHQRENYEINGNFPQWNGTVWKSFVKIKMLNKNVIMNCVNCDWGVGLIKKQKINNNFKVKKNLTYSFLKKNRNDLLSLISVKEFIENNIY